MTEGPVVETESELDARAQAALRVRGSRRTKVVLPRYAGFATRVVAFMLDAVVINLVAAMTAAGVALALSIFSVQNSTLVHDIQDAAPWLVATVFVVWSVAYFVTFWSTTGQTPGDRVMGIMVLREDEDKIAVARARKIQKFFSQPFFVAEAFTGKAGRYVKLEDTIRSFQGLVAGEYDHIPEQCFYMCGAIDGR